MSNANQFRVTAEYLREQGLSENFPDRFFSKIRFTESCWIWTRPPRKDGYGRFALSHSKSVPAHVASWMFFNGAIPSGLQVNHNCPEGDNRLCVNPAHLWVGTQAENVKDAQAKGRLEKGEHRWNAKLNPSDIVDIFRLHESGLSNRIIGNMKGVSHAKIWQILHRKNWSHIKI